MTTRNEKTTALPGLLSTVAAGFEIVTGHLWLVIFPIILDIFYWIGPQLRSTELWLSLADLFREVGVMVEMADQLAAIAGRTNMFTFLSVPFLGIPGLVSGIIMPERTPLQLLSLEVKGGVAWLLLFGAISFIGLLASAIYHALMARAVSLADVAGGEARLSESAQSSSSWLSLLRRLPVYCLRVLGLALALLFIVMVLYVPLMLVTTIATLISPVLGSLIMFGGLLMIVWIFFYLSFGLHGIVLRDRPVFPALLDSLKVVRNYWPSALTLFLLIVATRNILSWIWLLVDNGTWFTLLNIAGYAFVNAGLLAATFIFYRDRIRMLEQGFHNE